MADDARLLYDMVMYPRRLAFDFTYRLYQERNTSRSSPLSYREYPDGPMLEYNTGAGLNRLDE